MIGGSSRDVSYYEGTREKLFCFFKREPTFSPPRTISHTHVQPIAARLPFSSAFLLPPRVTYRRHCVVAMRCVCACVRVQVASKQARKEECGDASSTRPLASHERGGEECVCYYPHDDMRVSAAYLTY